MSGGLHRAKRWRYVWLVLAVMTAAFIAGCGNDKEEKTVSADNYGEK